MLPRLIRPLHLVGLLALGVVLMRPAAVHAQETSPLDDLIARVRADVNDLKYPEAIARGREVFAFARTARPAQLIALRQAMAAAFYPEEREAQQPDSALAHLRAAVRLQPDVQLAAELKWPGLDSLLEVARRTTFAVQLRPNAADTIVGPDGRAHVSFIASRPARYKLRVRALPNGASVAMDSVMTPSASGRLAIRAHDGRAALIGAGQYELLVTAYDSASSDSIVIRHDAEATATALTTVPRPMLDTTKLQNEFAKPKRTQLVVSSILYSTATFMIASSARAEEPILSGFGTDGRATFVGLSILGAGVGGFWLDKGSVNAEALRANLDLRVAHRTAVQAAEAENRRRIAEYRVTLRVRPEAR
jgi:hypothetical protein